MAPTIVAPGVRTSPADPNKPASTIDDGIKEVSMSNEYFDNVHKYVTDGRRLQGVSPERLREDWVAIFIDVAANPKNQLARDRLHEIESELHLLSRTPPYYHVAQVAPQHVGAVYVALEKLRKEYPEAYAAALTQWKVYAPKSRTWRSMHEASQKVVTKVAEAPDLNEFSSPSIIPSDDPDYCNCSPTSPPDEREAYFDNLATYARNGRRFQRVWVEALRKDFVSTFIDAATDPKDPSARDRLNDLVSEFHLRCMTPPYYRVVQVAPHTSSAVDDALEKLRKVYPEGCAAALMQWRYAPLSRHSIVPGVWNPRDCDRLDERAA
jgi:hypothetical protein